jgi:hypothetical protein
MSKSMFDEFGGYYSVLVEGIEIARWAPSTFWTEFWDKNATVGWSFRWVGKDS